MPWKPDQQRAIAAELSRKGRSPQQISDFFKSHGGGTAWKTKKARKRKADAIVTRG